MEHLGLDWDTLVHSTAPSAAALVEAVALGRASGLRAGRAEAAQLAERAYAEGLAAGRAMAPTKQVAAAPQDYAGARDDEPVLADVVDLRRRSAACGGREASDADRALIAAVLDNPTPRPRP